MKAIYRGHRYWVVSIGSNILTLQSFETRGPRVQLSVKDGDLILGPTADDLVLAEAFERGEIAAFEYPDGHTYPPNQEIPTHPTRHAPYTRH